MSLDFRPTSDTDEIHELLNIPQTTNEACGCYQQVLDLFVLQQKTRTALSSSQCSHNLLILYPQRLWIHGKFTRDAWINSEMLSMQYAVSYEALHGNARSVKPGIEKRQREAPSNRHKKYKSMMQ
ncbi:uncharacterized protein N7518_007681 [Penicillium psychrosexuale]|uniref:uncharacterized protein n=1 Tax=Penicillium psychrosexuale TaxID=1002107 RepID=UPI0025452408|nr:uncharacterized protein N7518_007681 [Penicillium psychrosexuale]KAJ5790670.1 hypothetical protein N7518_007681 [Penicillium psychrosexuale]